MVFQPNKHFSTSTLREEKSISINSTINTLWNLSSRSLQSSRENQVIRISNRVFKPHNKDKAAKCKEYKKSNKLFLDECRGLQDGVGFELGFECKAGGREEKKWHFKLKEQQK